MVCFNLNLPSDHKEYFSGPTYLYTIECIQLITIVIALYTDTLRDMASVFPSAYSAKHIRDSVRSNTHSKLDYEDWLKENPSKYNSKLMNSIWGIYNRYSPHNVKKINVNSFDELQTSPMAGSKPESVISSIPPKIWSAIGVSQSH